MSRSTECSMIYRHVTEITEVDQPTIPVLPNHWSERPSFGQRGFNDHRLSFGPFLKRKRTMESWEELSLSEEVRSFKRVRILSNIKKARRAAFASWEDKLLWKVGENEKIHTVSGEHSFETKSTSSARIDVGRNDLLASTLLSGASFYGTTKAEKSEERVPAQTIDIEEDPTHTTDFDEDKDSESTNSDIPVDDGVSGMLFKVLLLRRSCALRLNAKRARLLQFLSSGPILAPIAEPLCQVLDIGSDLMWSSMGKLTCDVNVPT